MTSWNSRTISGPMTLMGGLSIVNANRRSDGRVHANLWGSFRNSRVAACHAVPRIGVRSRKPVEFCHRVEMSAQCAAGN